MVNVIFTLGLYIVVSFCVLQQQSGHMNDFYINIVNMIKTEKEIKIHMDYHWTFMMAMKFG